jgi:NADPH-dependent glutamate synthase beta subunit-like oxidoreductase
MKREELLIPKIPAQHMVRIYHCYNNFVGLYACGWIKRGPSGIIGTNKWCAEDTTLSLIEDLKAQKHLNHPTSNLLGHTGLEKLLATRITPVSFQHWKHIENMEKEKGQSLGKEREKITSLLEIMEIIKSIK